MLGTIAQIAAYLLALLLPVIILGGLAAAFGWKIALACLVVPILVLAAYGLVRASA